MLGVLFRVLITPFAVERCAIAQN